MESKSRNIRAKRPVVPKDKKTVVKSDRNHIPYIYNIHAQNSDARRTGMNTRRKRELLTPIPVHGVVKQWDIDNGYGFITPEVSLEKIRGYTGRVFVHVNDLLYGLEKLTVNDEVTFTTYRDEVGIGAIDVCLRSDEQLTHANRAVVTMIIPNKLLPRLIGRRGETINNICNESKCDIYIHSDNKNPRHNQLVTVSGGKESLPDGIKMICDNITETSGSYNAKLTFLIPEDETGRFIGTEGKNIRKIIEDNDRVTISVSKYTVRYENSYYNKIILFGPSNKIDRSIEEISNQLCRLYQMIVRGPKKRNPNKNPRRTYDRNAKRSYNKNNSSEKVYSNKKNNTDTINNDSPRNEDNHSDDNKYLKARPHADESGEAREESQ